MDGNALVMQLSLLLLIRAIRIALPNEHGPFSPELAQGLFEEASLTPLFRLVEHQTEAESLLTVLV